MRIIKNITISFFNALLELFVALKSISMFVQWLLDFCTYEVEIEDEHGTIIHYFPQLNFGGGDDDDF